jgi:hypothetical protein
LGWLLASVIVVTVHVSSPFTGEMRILTKIQESASPVVLKYESGYSSVSMIKPAWILKIKKNSGGFL